MRRCLLEQMLNDLLLDRALGQSICSRAWIEIILCVIFLQFFIGGLWEHKDQTTLIVCAGVKASPSEREAVLCRRVTDWTAQGISHSVPAPHNVGTL